MAVLSKNALAYLTWYTPAVAKLRLFELFQKWHLFFIFLFLLQSLELL